jgi:hypothetical protein
MRSNVQREYASASKDEAELGTEPAAFRAPGRGGCEG